MITVDDIVHIIQEEAGEDVLLLSGAGEGDINEPIIDTYKARVRWLAANLLTALVAVDRHQPVRGFDRAAWRCSPR